MVHLPFNSRPALLPRDTIRANQTKTLVKLQSTTQELEDTARAAVRAWNTFTKSMETMASLYEQCATLLPSVDHVGELGLDAELGISEDTVKVCKTLKKTVELWTLSDEVVDVRAHLSAEATTWLQMTRHVSHATSAALERKAQQPQLKSLQRDLRDLRKKKKKSKKTEAQEQALLMNIGELKLSMRAQDCTVTTGLKAVMKKSILREPERAEKLGSLLRKVGQNTAKAFDAFQRGGEVLDFVTPDITQTPAMGVPLELDYPSSQHSQSASPASMEAEYGQGAPYAASPDLLSDLSDGDTPFETEDS